MPTSRPSARLPLHRLLPALALGLAAGAAQADIRVLLGVDPADAAPDLMVSASLGPSQSLGRATGGKATITQTSSMADVMRASRTVENEVIIAPSHVTASAILHAYQLVATTGQEQTYVLVAKNGIDSVEKLPGKRLYLPQQDSLRSYVAKGLLTDSKIKLDQFAKVTYGNTSGGGLVAISFDVADVTIADEKQAKDWIAAHPGQARILKSTRPVPGGMSMVVRKDYCAQECARLVEWVNNDGNIPGLARLRAAPADAAKQFTYVASLGITTPDKLDGVTRVGADEVADLLKQGAIVIDTRSQKEYDSEHIRGAILASYLEKSLKEIGYDASKDDFAALAKAAPKDKPVVFLCNGPECWKSYKASRWAQKDGYQKIYWFRGGMPEWREKRMPVEGSTGAQLANVAPKANGGRSTVAAR